MKQTMTSTHKMILGAFFIVLGILIPYFVGHAAGIPGTILLPMHLSVFIAGMILGPKKGRAMWFDHAHTLGATDGNAGVLSHDADNGLRIGDLWFRIRCYARYFKETDLCGSIEWNDSRKNCLWSGIFSIAFRH